MMIKVQNNNLGLVQGRRLGCNIVSVDVQDRIYGKRMHVVLDNGFGLSILTGGQFYTDGGTFEVGILDEGGSLVSPFEVDGDGVYGYLSSKDVADLIVKVSHIVKERNLLVV